MSKLKIITPASMLIEQTAGEFAGVFFDAARSSGMHKIKLRGQVINLDKYNNNPRKFAKAHLKKFIPDAVQHLIKLLGMPHMSPDQKEIIYQAIMERVNDPQLDALAKSTQGALPEFEQTVLYKPDNEKPKPIEIKTNE